ncbi:hypothetical protein XANCAGTX0491_003728 [Xanthoria calcicola]
MVLPTRLPTSRHAKRGAVQARKQKVIASASSVLEFMKERRAAQASTGKFAKATSWTGTSSKSHESQKDATESVDPFALRERLVFRRNVPIDADSFILLQNRHRKVEAFINRSLVLEAETVEMLTEIFGEDSPFCPEEDEILFRCTLRDFHEARLRELSQSLGITADYQEEDVLESVFKVRRKPNHAEMILLCQLTGHTSDDLDAWFLTKTRRVKALEAGHRENFPTNTAIYRRRFAQKLAPYLKKPHSMH